MNIGCPGQLSVLLKINALKNGEIFQIEFTPEKIQKFRVLFFRVFFFNLLTPVVKPENDLKSTKLIQLARTRRVKWHA